MPPLCACGCGNPVRMRNGHWNTYLKGHAKKRGTYAIDAESGCWVWQGLISDQGYGMVDVHKKRWRAHVLEWTKVNGPVPDGLELDHTCRNRACCNPDHLEAVTHTVNMRRGTGVVLSEEKVRVVRRLLREGMLQKHIAARVGVSTRVISHVNCGQTWVGVD